MIERCTNEPTLAVAVARTRSSPRRLTSAAATGRGVDIGQFGILVVVDSTEASKRAVQYISRILAGREGVAIHLAYVAPHLPPALLETGGAELPEREEQVEAAMRSDQLAWLKTATEKAKRTLLLASTTLQRAGAPASQIHTCISSSLDAQSPVDAVILLARQHECRTIVAGHRAHTLFHGLGGGHLAEQLVRRAAGFAVWVID